MSPRRRQGRSQRRADRVHVKKSGKQRNGKDKSEGLRYKNVFGCYSHGPVLPLNPALCDLLLETALTHKYGKEIKLEPLADGAETAARSALLKRLTGKGKE